MYIYNTSIHYWEAKVNVTITFDINILTQYISANQEYEVPVVRLRSVELGKDDLLCDNDGLSIEDIEEQCLNYYLSLKN